MTTFEKTLSLFDYTFPLELIAQQPASPRDNAKLLTYDRTTKQVSEDIFKNLGNYLPKDSVVVLNQTKVLPARLVVTKPTGGKAKLLYISHNTELVTFLSNRKLEIGSTLKISNRLSLLVNSKEDQLYFLKPNFPISKIEDVLTLHGQTPLPPYIKHSPLKGKKLLNEYNTVFAKNLGSVASPTASLHLTKQLISRLSKQGVTFKYVTLHVNLGTFASLTEQQLKSKLLHSEYYEIGPKTADFLNKSKEKGRPIVAVGTTVVRTLESAANPKGVLVNLHGETKLFLTEKSKLKFVDHLITNFHVPKSSLLMLVSAFVGRKQLLALYKFAIQKKFRLFSFGDAMFIK